MDIFPIISFFIVGALAGILGGMLGLSGGIVIVPSLLVIFQWMDFDVDYVMHMAIGTSLAAMVMNAAVSTISHHRRGTVMWEIILAMLPGVLLGCMLGSSIAHFLSGIVLQVIFGIFISILGTYVLLKKPNKEYSAHKPDKAFLTWIGIGIGTLSSSMGVGGGIFMVPLLLSYHYRERKAVGTSAAFGLMITLFAALAYFYFGREKDGVPFQVGYIYLPAFLIVGVSCAIFAPIGAALTHKISGEKLRRIFAGSLIIIGILMIFN